MQKPEDANPARKSTITVTLDESYYDEVEAQAQMEERSLAMWVRRYLHKNLERDFNTLNLTTPGA